jgi:uncharacterized alpha-E superfamily protein
MASGTDMLSRVAENLYWISRYVERAEDLSRLLDDAFSLELEAGAHADGQRPLESVLTMLNGREAFAKFRPTTDAEPAGDVPASAADERDAILHFLTFDKHDGVSIRSLVANARENARGTQEALSGEAWSQLNKLYLHLISDRAARQFAASPHRCLARVRRECVLFAALIDGTLPRTEAFHFLQVGRYLERVDMLSRIMNVHCHAITATNVDAGFPPSHWTGLLRGASAHEAYLRQAGEHLDPVGVVRYLLLEEDFPRSMRFGVARCLESLKAIAGGGASEAERHMGRLESELRFMDISDLFRRGVGAFLSNVQEVCAAVGSGVNQAYFRT